MQNKQCYQSLLAIVILFTVPFLISFSRTDGYAQSLTQNVSDEIPPTTNSLDSTKASPIVNPLPGSLPVYFNPQDSDGTGTVIILMNSNDTVKTVPLRGYDPGGAGLVYTQNLVLQPFERKICVSDAVAAAPPPSWATTVSTNFTDFVGMAVLYLPDGVFVDGYVVFNLGTGTIDPRADQGAIPLTFSTEATQGSHFFVVPVRR